MYCYEDFLPWNNNFMLRSGTNIFVSQILVQGRCVTRHRYLSLPPECIRYLTYYTCQASPPVSSSRHLMDISIMEIVGILITLFVSSMVMQFSPNHLKVSFYCDYLSEVMILYIFSESFIHSANYPDDYPNNYKQVNGNRILMTPLRLN